MSSAPATVLVVDDDRAVAELYGRWLAESYDVRTAHSGEEALDALDADVDCVLLDRRMPGLTGDEVLEEIRERDLDCRVAMVTAVTPDFDVLAMGFDDYVTKPVDRAELLAMVERVLALDTYDDLIGRYYALVSKRVAIESAKTEAELEENEEYQRLLEEVERISEEADASLETLFEKGSPSSGF